MVEHHMHKRYRSMVQRSRMVPDNKLALPMLNKRWPMDKRCPNRMWPGLVRVQPRQKQTYRQAKAIATAEEKWRKIVK